MKWIVGRVDCEKRSKYTYSMKPCHFVKDGDFCPETTICEICILNKRKYTYRRKQVWHHGKTNQLTRSLQKVVDVAKAARTYNGRVVALLVQLALGEVLVERVHGTD